MWGVSAEIFTDTLALAMPPSESRSSASRAGQRAAAGATVSSASRQRVA